MEAEKINIRKFDPLTIKNHSIFMVIGKRLSGKTTLVKDILKKINDSKDIVNKFQRLSVISSSPTASTDYNMIFSTTPEVTHYQNYDSEIIKLFVDNQRKLITQKHDDERQNGKSSINPTSLLVLDDCNDVNFLTKNKKNTYMPQLIMNNQSYYTNLIITAQYSLGIPPALRSNVDYIFIFRDDIISNRERLYSHYAGMFPTFESFNQIMDQCTENFECLVIDNTTRSSKVEDCVFRYTAEI
jgi:hypothetical protein